MNSDLTDLVENPREDLGIECKAWLDLTNNLQRAKIARHLAALANHGGGYLLFGFKDDLTPDPDSPTHVKMYNRDVFSDIVHRYLTPRFQCEVIHVAAHSGDEFAIVRVPGHGSVPIAARADGPRGGSGGPQGIRAGVYYIRKPGPESAPAIGAEDWAPLIRRCVLNDRDALLRDFSTLMRQREQPIMDAGERLTDWHRNGEQRFLALLPDDIGSRWPVPLNENRYQLSYLISTEEEETLQIGGLARILEEINVEVRSTVWTGWSMFYPFTRPDIAPRLYPENVDGTGGDVVECNLIVNRNFDTSLPDYWRLAPDGRVTLVRAYREDRLRSATSLHRRSGTWLSPETVVRETTELVTHARLLARYFEAPTRIAFRCSWLGLRGRQFADFDPAIDWGIGYVASADRRTSEGEWPVATMAATWTGIVSQLCFPVLNLFGFTRCSAEFVERLAPRFVKL